MNAARIFQYKDEKERLDCLRDVTAQYLAKAGMPEDQAFEILQKLAAADHVDSTDDEIRSNLLLWYETYAAEANRPPARFISKEVGEFVAVTSGYFSVTDCYNSLQAVTKQDKGAVRIALMRLQKSGIIDKHGNRDGVYRKVETDLNHITFDDTEEKPFPIILPFGLHSMVDISEGNIILVGGEFNSGKGHPDGTLLLGKDGWMKIEDVRVGDDIFSQDGTLCKITGVFPRGEQECMRFVFSDKTSIVTDYDHLWNVMSPYSRNHTTTGRGNTSLQFGKYQTMDARSIFSGIGGFGKVKPQRRYMIPSNDPIQFPGKEVSIDPYLMGLMLGDGSLTQDTPGITTGDIEIIEYCREHWSVGSVRKDKRNECWNVSLLGMRRALAPYKLVDHRSWEKFIPKEYMFNSVDIRLSLLRGLMDTDGDISKNGMTVCFSTVSARLADDVMFLVRSLGGRVVKSVRQTGYKHNGVKNKGRLSYRLFITIKGLCPFSLKRKMERYSVTARTSNKIITEIWGAGVQKTTCISVSAPSGLYVAQDFIVTHNTTFCLETLLSNKNSIPIRYLSSEVSHQSEFKKRWRKYTGIPLTFWYPDDLTDYVSRSSDFASALRPGALNIIDYMEFPESDFTLGGEMLRQIHDKLNGGVCLVAIQKKQGTRLPRSGDLVMEKPRLAITLSSADGKAGSNNGIAEIVKAKLCRGGNHNGKKLIFETVDEGSRFKIVEPWGFLRT